MDAETVANYSDDKLAEEFDLWDTNYQSVRQARALLEAEIIRRLHAMGATEGVTDNWVMSLKPPKEKYEWDYDQAMALRKDLPAEDKDIVTPILEVKVDARRMLAIARRRGEQWRSRIESAHRKVRVGVPHAEVNRRLTDGND